MNYTYRCPGGHEMVAVVALDQVTCLEHGVPAKRVRSFGLKLPGETARWDPVVGEYVRNEAEFRSILSQQMDRESRELNMEVKLTLVDSRDKEGIAELHGRPLTTWKAEAENTAKAKHDQAVT